MRLVEQKRERGATDAAEWQARVDLAAARRLAVGHGFSEGIFNHFTLAVPGKDDRYYQIPFGLHWSEVTASVLMEVGYDGTVLSGEGEVERSGFCIHAPIHRLIPRHACLRSGRRRAAGAGPGPGLLGAGYGQSRRHCLRRDGGGCL